MLYGAEFAGKAHRSLQGSGTGNRAHRGAWHKESVEPIALAGDADCGRAAGAGGAPVHDLGPGRTFDRFRIHRAAQRQWCGRFARPPVLKRATDHRRARSEASSARPL